MTIGRFARISGLSVHTLRHYDDVGILAPAEVDPASGYRRYRRDQIRHARFIQALRFVDLPVEEIRTALADDTGDAVNEILRRHRRTLRRYGEGAAASGVEEPAVLGQCRMLVSQGLTAAIDGCGFSV